MSASLPNTTEFRGRVAAAESIETELLFVPVFGPDDPLAEYPSLEAAVDGEWSRTVRTGEFGSKPYVQLVARVSRIWKASHVCFVGAGARSDADDTRWRRLGAVCGAIARQRRARHCAWLIREGCEATVSAAVVDGFTTAEFDSGAYKTDPSAALPIPVVVEIVGAAGTDAAALDASILRGRTIGRAVNVARTLSNEPANVLTPQAFASRTAALAESAGLKVDMLDQARMQELGMGLLLAVAQGSVEPPRMVVLRHDPPSASASPVIALVGKGVTFDTGGVSIKPAEAMDRMKADMAGGAAVAAAMWALGSMKVPCRVMGLIPMVENMVGGRAFRPGDVFSGANGKTVEILNTDAEGRLILADALWYAQQLGATHLVDIATLTGHCVIGLGRTVAGLLGRPDAWVETVRGAADRAGDRVWPLPIYEEALDQLRSEIADLTNVGGRPGGAITAAAFLREFAGDRPWVHLDIAGPAWAEAKTAFQPKGATGAGVRTLIAVATEAEAWSRG